MANEIRIDVGDVELFKEMLGPANVLDRNAFDPAGPQASIGAEYGGIKVFESSVVPKDEAWMIDGSGAILRKFKMKI